MARKWGHGNGQTWRKLIRNQNNSINDENKQIHDDDAARYIALANLRTKPKPAPKQYKKERGTFGAASRVRRIDPRTWKG